MKKLVIIVSMLAGLGILLATSQDDLFAQEISKLSKDIANLGLRVDHLEHAAGVTPASSSGAGAGSAAASGGDPVRTMVLVSINETHDDASDEEIAQLQKQCAALMNTVNSAADKAASDAGQNVYAAHVRGGVRGWNGGEEGGAATTNLGSRGRKMVADREIENQYATLHVIKKKKLEALQRAKAEAKQIILGHDGNTIITLETKRDLSSELNNIAIGALVTWKGTRLNADDGSETWRIDSIGKAAKR